MSDSAGAALAMAIGILGTSTIHLSKGVMRLGLAGIRGEGETNAKAIYVTGVLMNFTNPLWVILANRFAPTVYYTSMYGLGLLPLLLFSRFALGERLEKQQYLAIAVIVLGTLLVGAAGAFAMIQWSYLRSCRASMMGSVYDVAYVGVPLLVTALIVEGTSLDLVRLTGLALLALGVVTVGRVQGRPAEAVEPLGRGASHSQM